MELPTPEELKRWRKEEVNITQSELAERAGVSQPLIARIEGSDVDPRLSTLRRIVNVLERADDDVAQADEIMQNDVVSVAPDDSVREAEDLMEDHNFSQLPVIEGSNPVGMISHSDIIQADTPPGGDIGDLPVDRVMNENIFATEPEATIDEVKRLLLTYDAVVVKSGGEIIGIITEADVVASFA